MKRTRVALLVMSVSAAAIGCGGGGDSTQITVGGKQVELKTIATVTRQVRPAKHVAYRADFDRVRTVGIDLQSPELQLLGRSPKEGQYKYVRNYFGKDTCGVDLSQGVVADMFIENYDKNAKTFDFVTRSVDGSDEIRTPCTMDRLGFRFTCQDNVQTTDFTLFGLDAVVTIVNRLRGFWIGRQSYIGFTGSDFTCVGMACATPPVSNLFGTFSNSIPCETSDIVKVKAL
jgi:hypothetical protein